MDNTGIILLWFWIVMAGGALVMTDIPMQSATTVVSTSVSTAVTE